MKELTEVLKKVIDDPSNEIIVIQRTPPTDSDPSGDVLSRDEIQIRAPVSYDLNPAPPAPQK